VDLCSRVYGKENELIRAGLVRLLSGALPLYVVNEFPKSGGTWVGQMLGRALGVPFPRNRLRVLRPSIMHGHYLSPWGIKNAVAAWESTASSSRRDRDGEGVSTANTAVSRYS
jgi:hypothetical protein